MLVRNSKTFPICCITRIRYYDQPHSRNHRNSRRGESTSNTIGSIIRGYKIGITKWCSNNTNIQTVWQRNYYDHIIRNENSFKRISEYIVNNPVKWSEDRFWNN